MTEETFKPGDKVRVVSGGLTMHGFTDGDTVVIIDDIDVPGMVCALGETSASWLHDNEDTRKVVCAQLLYTHMVEKVEEA